VRPNECNAHPHTDCTNTIAVVHNGIIENFSALRKMLEMQGHNLNRRRIPKVLAHLIEAATGNGDPLEDAVIDALNLVEGTYGIAVLSSRDPDKIVCAAREARSSSDSATASSTSRATLAAILQHTRQVVYLDDGEMGVLTRNGYEVLDLDARRVKKGVSRIDWKSRRDREGRLRPLHAQGIFEQPQTIENTMRGRLVIEEGFSKLGGLNLSKEDLLAIDNIIITACGTAGIPASSARCTWRSWRACAARWSTRRSSAIEPDRHRQDAVRRRLTVRRDGRHARRDARSKARGREDARSGERRRLDDRA
jgi:glucosamine--fructose-6-phosphate aminotransferase (isomerizing)